MFWHGSFLAIIFSEEHFCHDMVYLVQRSKAKVPQDMINRNAIS